MKASHNQIDDGSGQKLPVMQEQEQNCAFDGAMITLVSIADAAHLVHGPSGCVGTFLSGNNTADGILNQIRFTTDMEESDIIFGGAKKLYKAILEVHRRYSPSAIFVYSTCVSAMIGDDISGAARDATEQLRIPVIPVDSPGFIGSKNSGVRIVGDVLLEHVIGTGEPEFTTDYDINLIGDSDGAVEIESMLETVGIRVLAKITGNSRYQELCCAHRAKLNVIISSKPLLKMAKQMEKRFNIPYIQVSLYSLEEISNCLHNIAAKLNKPELTEPIEKVIAEQNTNLNTQLGFYRPKFKNKRIILEITSNTWSIISVAKNLNLNLNIIPIVSSKISQEEQARIQALLNQDVIIIEQTNQNQVLQLIQDSQADMLVARASYQNTAIQAQIPFLDVNTLHVYTGYRKIISAVQKLYAAFQSPIWQQLHKSAPWE